MSKEDLERIEEILEAKCRENSSGDMVLQSRRGSTFNIHGLLTKVRQELNLVPKVSAA